MSLLISIVSHGQASLVHRLLEDIDRYCPDQDLHVLLTLNRREALPFRPEAFGFPLTVLPNHRPKGFGANHNAAFQRQDSDYFAVLNPDLRLLRDPFTPLLLRLRDEGIGVAAPLIVDESHQVEDNFRRLPTPWRLLKRYWKGRRGRSSDYPLGDGPLYPDWVAGMFMLFPSAVFARHGGFQEKYFLYFEDVDLCSRLRLAGYKILLDPEVLVVHNARRESHKNLRYLGWHLKSGILFFCSPVFWAAWRQKRV